MKKHHSNPRAPRSMKPFTEQDLAEFDRIISLCDSRQQMDRIIGRGEMREFIEKHTKEKCDLMFAELERRDKKS